jgi:hypothetical protein
MLREVEPLLCELFLAYITAERFLSRVHKHMALQIKLPSETIVTKVAFEFLGSFFVKDLVLFKVIPSFESFSTNFTVGIHGSVILRVSSKMVFKIKSFSTLGAFEIELLEPIVVQGQVSLKGSLPIESSAAKGALKTSQVEMG